MDPAVQRIALGAGGISALVIVVALLWSGVRGTGFGPPPLILPPPGPLRVAPVDPGGLTVPEAGVQIMSGDDASQPLGLAPTGDAPDLQGLDQAAGLNPPAPVVSVPAPVPSGKVMVQLAAAADEPGAQAAWDRLKAKMPDLLAGKTPEIVPAVVKGQSLWRLRLGGFASNAEAQAFCARLATKGAACTVAAF